MSFKTGKSSFDSNTNQLPYKGDPGTYAYWLDCLSESFPEGALDRYIDDAANWEHDYTIDGVPDEVRRFRINWIPLDPSYSTVYAKFRIRSESLNSSSFWSVPQLLNIPVRYAVYKRKVNQSPNQWELVEITTSTSVGPYIESFAGRVQYAVCIYHKDSTPGVNEGLLWELDDVTVTHYCVDLQNPYILFVTNPYYTIMNTRRWVFASITPPPNPDGPSPK